VMGVSLGVGVPGEGTVSGSKLSNPFNYDSGLLYLDGTNDRVGIGTTNPTTKLDVGGIVLANGINITGVTTVAAGSTAAPSITPTGDSNTGIFFPSADTIAFSEGGTEALRIDSSGRVTMPYQPIFMAYGNTLQNLNTSASPVKIEFTATEDIDNGSYFDAPNSNFNVPVTGKYLVYASVMLSSNFTNYDFLFMDFGKNNSRLAREIMMPRPGGGSFVSAQGSVIISAAAGDTIQVYLVQYAGTAAVVRDAFRHFYGFLIG